MTKPFDKIFRENIAELIDTIIVNILDLEIVFKKSLEIKLETTIEREPDFCYEVIDKSGKKMILHIEMQSTNNEEMVFRMVEYGGFMARRYKIPILQFVIYFGKKPLKMENKLEFGHFTYKYGLVNFQDFSFEKMLNSEVAEVVILALLCNYENLDARSVISKILKRLYYLHHANKIKLIEKYIAQLRILARARKLTKIFNQEDKKMAISSFNFNYKTDPYYLDGIKDGEQIGEKRGEKRGEKIGERKTKIEMAKLMKNLNEPIDKIVLYTGLDKDFIENL